MVRSGGKSGQGTTCDAARGPARRRLARPAPAGPARDQPRRRGLEIRSRAGGGAPPARGRPRLPPPRYAGRHGGAAIRRRSREVASLFPPPRRDSRRPRGPRRPSADRGLDGDEPRLRDRRRGGRHRRPRRDRPVRTEERRVNVGGSAAGAIVDVILWLLQGVWWIVIIAALISWVNPDPRNPIVRFLWGVTEPLFRPFRRLLPPSRTGNIDLSPLVVLAIIFLLIRFLTRLAYSGQLAY